MIVISMKFCAGRFHATVWDRQANESSVEYPPSTWRLLRALLAVFYRTRPDGATEEQLTRVVNKLASAPPSFHLPRATVAHTRHYDNGNGEWRLEKGNWKLKGVPLFHDTFLSINPEDALVWYWEVEPLDEPERQLLTALLRNLNSFGRAESWCEAELKEDVDEHLEINSRPYTHDIGEPVSGKELSRVLLPEAGVSDLLDKLKLIAVEDGKPMKKGEKLVSNASSETQGHIYYETGDLRGRKKIGAPVGSHWQTYERERGIIGEGRLATSNLLARGEITHIVRFALDATVLPSVRSALPFAEAVRRTLIKLRDKRGYGHSDTLYGKTRDGVPLKGHKHAYYLPTDEDGDGLLDTLTIYSVEGFTEKEPKKELESLVELEMEEIFSRGRAAERVKLIFTGSGKREDEWLSGNGEHIPLLATSRRWRSFTPFSLSRFLTRGAGKPPRPRDLSEGQLRREAHLHGLSEVVSFAQTRGYRTRNRCWPWYEFHARRYNDTQGYGVTGFEMEFANKEQGPIALGFASHFGLGLFLPVDE